MELLQEYIHRAQYVQGVYVLKAGDMPYEDAARFAEAWQEQFGDSKVLIIVPNNEDLQYLRHFDFSIALTLVKSGWKVTRFSKINSYLYLDENTGTIMEQIVIPGHEPTEYTADGDDMMADDWIVYHN
jgi:hypothetical protein